MEGDGYGVLSWLLCFVSELVGLKPLFLGFSLLSIRATSCTYTISGLELEADWGRGGVNASKHENNYFSSSTNAALERVAVMLVVPATPACCRRAALFFTYDPIWSSWFSHQVSFSSTLPLSPYLKAMLRPFKSSPPSPFWQPVRPDVEDVCVFHTDAADGQ